MYFFHDEVSRSFAKRPSQYALASALCNGGATTPRICGVVAPPLQSAEASAYWEGRFAKLRETSSWKKYIHDNQLEEHFAPGAEMRKSVVEIEKQLKDAYQMAGIKT